VSGASTGAAGLRSIGGQLLQVSRQEDGQPHQSSHTHTQATSRTQEGMVLRMLVTGVVTTARLPSHRAPARRAHRASARHVSSPASANGAASGMVPSRPAFPVRQRYHAGDYDQLQPMSQVLPRLTPRRGGGWRRVCRCGCRRTAAAEALRGGGRGLRGRGYRVASHPADATGASEHAKVFGGAGQGAAAASTTGAHCTRIRRPPDFMCNVWIVWGC